MGNELQNVNPGPPDTVPLDLGDVMRDHRTGELVPSWSGDPWVTTAAPLHWDARCWNRLS